MDRTGAAASPMRRPSPQTSLSSEINYQISKRLTPAINASPCNRSKVTLPVPTLPRSSATAPASSICPPRLSSRVVTRAAPSPWSSRLIDEASVKWKERRRLASGFPPRRERRRCRAAAHRHEKGRSVAGATPSFRRGCPIRRRRRNLRRRSSPGPNPGPSPRRRGRRTR